MATPLIPDLCIGGDAATGSGESPSASPRRVGLAEPCYIIAEAGSNHNGSLDAALRLIDAAADARADAVKFQTFRADKLYPRGAGKSDYLGDERSIYDIIQAMEMPPDWLPKLAEHARARGLHFLTSAFDEASVDLVDPYVPAFKCASYEMTHAPLLQHMARKGKPVIVSTGTATLVEVGEAVRAARRAGNRDLILLQCTAAYPAPLESINARALATLREVFGVLTGLSDHSRDPIVAPMAAAALGAVVIEKHFTLSNRLPGPDHPFAVEPRELAELVRRVREVEAARGTGGKVVQPVEEELRRFARRSVFATRRIDAGERLTQENTAVLRCGKLGYGLHPAEHPHALGRAARRVIERDTPIGWDDLSPASAEPPRGVTLREAGPGDARAVWAWKNDPEALRTSFRTPEPVPWEDHERWYARRLAMLEPCLWIIEDAGRSVGSIRIDREPDRGVISIAVDPGARGRGVGAQAIALACGLFAAAGGPARVEALIKPDNDRSARAFRSAGFVPAGSREIDGQPAFVYRSPAEDGA